MKRCTFLLAVTAVLLLINPAPARAQVSFISPPAYSGGGNVFVADFNGDGKPDILTSDGTMNLGNGDGTFKLGTALASGSLPVMAVADFNGDGKTDVLEQGTGTLLVLLGNGDGTFQAPVSTPSGASLSNVAAVDLNGDGSADVVGVFSGAVVVYLSNADGTFKSGVSYSLGVTSASYVLSLDDFNGDGKIDIAVSTSGAPGEVVVFLGKGDGSFQTTAKISTGINSPQYGTVGDFNGDGILDLALTESNCFSNCNADVLLGQGDGTFQAPVVGFLGIGQPAAVDINGDGKWDLILAANIGIPAAVQIYIGNGDGTFSDTSNYAGSLASLNIASSAQGLALADFNGDGKADIAAGNVVLLGSGGGSFQGISLGVVPSGGPAAVGDFDKNLTIDVAVASQTYSTNSVYILNNDGTGKLSLAHTYTLQQPGYAIATADFNGDGNLDLMIYGLDQVTNDWSYSVLLGNGDGSFQPAVFNPQSRPGLTGSTASIVVADFNNDGKLDVAVPAGNNSLAVLLGNGDGTFGVPAYYFDGGASSVIAADFNADGNVDIVAGGAVGSSGQPETGILIGNGDGTFQNAVFPANLSNDFAVQRTADLNNDGKPDLISHTQVALGNGDGTFTLLPGVNPPIDGIADFNGDGKLDALSGNSVSLGNGDGTFGSPITILNATVLDRFPLLTVDMDNDGRTDLVIPYANFAPPGGTPAVSGIAVLINTTPASFVLTSGVSAPNPVIAGNTASATVNVSATFGFNKSVSLSCTGLPNGTNCVFSPATIATGSGTSTLTVTTSASTAAGSYAVQLVGTAGSVVNGTSLSLVVQAPADFNIGPASGSPTSQTVSAGQSATFNLALAPSGSFTGTVNLACVITPVATPAPTCTLSSSSVQINGSGTQSVSLVVGTTAAGTTGTTFYVDFPSVFPPLAYILALLGLTWKAAGKRRRPLIFSAPLMLLALSLATSCGGSSSHKTQGTPPGTYTAVITATSGSLNHNSDFQVIVH